LGERVAGRISPDGDTIRFWKPKTRREVSGRETVADPAVLGLIGKILESHREASRRIYGTSLFDTRRVGIGLSIGNLTSQFLPASISTNRRHRDD